MHRIEKGSNVLLNDVYTNVPCVMPSFLFFFLTTFPFFQWYFSRSFLYFSSISLISNVVFFIVLFLLDVSISYCYWENEKQKMNKWRRQRLPFGKCWLFTFAFKRDFFFHFHFFLFLFTSSQPLWFGVDWLHITFGILNISSTQQVTQ